MYFSAACLIGMKPLLNPLLSKIPSLFNSRAFRSTKSSKVNTFGKDTLDRVPLKNYRQRNQYASMQDGDDIERGLHKQERLGSDISMPPPMYDPMDSYIFREDHDMKSPDKPMNMELGRGQLGAYPGHPGGHMRVSSRQVDLR